jgi:poly-gamma-glutamate synthesis protein (capsule biosynthesis protein)
VRFRLRTPALAAPLLAAALVPVLARGVPGRRPLAAPGRLTADGRRRTAPTDTLRIVHVGDINFARGLARNVILPGRGAEVFAEVRDALRSADLAIGNLESVLVDRGDYADPPMTMVFAGPGQGANLLRDAGFAAVATANNHAWDFRRAGVLESLAHLDSAGVAHAGTGATTDEAWRPAIVRRRGWTVALFSLTAIFNAPDLTVVGHEAACCVAWADTARFRRAARAARDSLGADIVLVSLHHGLEYRPVPPPRDVALARALVRAGADAVIGHHPHVPQGVEWVDGKPVLYSLGNFVFLQNSPWTRSGLWAELTFVPGGPPRVVVRPVAAGNAPRFQTGADSAATMAHLADLSERVGALPEGRPGRNVTHLRPRPRPRRVP